MIIIDPLTMAETAKAALDLYYANRPHKPVVAVIYSHTHADHFGGVRGVIDEADARPARSRCSPGRVMEHVMSENVYAGNAMSRRAQYQFGSCCLAVNRVGRRRPGQEHAQWRHYHADSTHRPDHQELEPAPSPVCRSSFNSRRHRSPAR